MQKTFTRAEFNSAVKAAFKLGRDRGQVERQRTMERMVTANCNLWQEIIRLDEQVPLSSVKISYLMASSILKKLIKHTEAKALCLKLRRAMECQQCDVSKIIEGIKTLTQEK